MVTVAIAMFIAHEFFFIGVVLALWAVVMMAIVPLGKGLTHLAHPALRTSRPRVLAVTGAFLVAVLALLFVVPAPFRTVLEGVAWLPESSMVRAEQEGFVERVVAAPGSRVQPGDLLVQVRNPALESAASLARAKVAEFQAVHLASLQVDRARSQMALDQLEAERMALASAEHKLAQLDLRAGAPGRFLIYRAEDLPGRFHKQGELVGYVIEQPRPLARVVAPQDAADVVRSSATRIQVRMAHDPERILPGRLEREVPGGDDYLPSKALATEGGGQIATDVRDGRGARTLERTFQFDIAVDVAAGTLPLFFGERVHVRFEHPDEPIGLQWLRTLRRLFLSQFHV
jgi:putative peptide zinc metalloprotease protein